MKLFQCQRCQNLLYFENRICQRCGSTVGYIADGEMSALDPDGDSWRALAAPGRLFRFCANYQHDACNWLVDAASPEIFCAACRHNGVIPDISVANHLRDWRVIEIAKHRLFYSLLRWRLPLRNHIDDPAHGLVFEFLADPPEGGPAPPQPHVMTGHEEGRITIALAEADDLERERRRLSMNEPYRTLLGHFRHEIAHHYWDILVRDGGRLDAFRAMFGDERLDYGEALQRHHANGALSDWETSFVSAYATMHPWEDFAETWAHYFHIVDTLEMAGEFGMDVKPKIDETGELHGELDFDPYESESIEQLINAWLPLTFAMNNINRSMGLPDVYPFLLNQPAIAKLGFVRELIRESGAAGTGATAAASAQ